MRSLHFSGNIRSRVASVGKQSMVCRGNQTVVHNELDQFVDEDYESRNSY
jgi:hypothetical protein